ncbi:hypothetical protein PM082_004557 [Marasmius tenuissimus]|nr:hypothetical protein PM082_004557 [Marasmius tenuissimus]
MYLHRGPLAVVAETVAKAILVLLNALPSKRDVVDKEEDIDLDTARKHNLELPVSCLPTEIIVMIFTIVCQDSHTYHYYLGVSASPIRDYYPFSLFAVSSICHEWREIAINTPHLWSTPNLDCPALAKIMLERSKDSPLALSLDEKHLHRDPALFWLCLDRFSQTHDLFIEVTDPHILHSVLSSVSHVNSTLAELSLTIGGEDGTVETPFSYIVAVLALTPNLKELTLFVTLGPHPLLAHTQIPLKELEILYISTLGYGIYHFHLFDALKVPSTTRIFAEFPAYNSQTLERISRLCNARIVTQLRLNTETSRSKRWIVFESWDHELSVTVPTLARFHQFLSPLQASLTQLTSVSLEITDSRNYGEVLDLLDTARNPFPLAYLTSLELRRWQPSTDSDMVFQLEVVRLITIIQSRSEQ